MGPVTKGSDNPSVLPRKRSSVSQLQDVARRCMPVIVVGATVAPKQVPTPRTTVQKNIQRVPSRFAESLPTRQHP